jgi:hypothetical protein
MPVADAPQIRGRDLACLFHQGVDAGVPRYGRRRWANARPTAPSAPLTGAHIRRTSAGRFRGDTALPDEVIRPWMCSGPGRGCGDRWPAMLLGVPSPQIHRGKVVPAIAYAAAQHESLEPFARSARVVVVRLTLSDASGTLNPLATYLQAGGRRTSRVRFQPA